jgi:DNA-binding protein HU-beta
MRLRRQLAKTVPTGGSKKAMNRRELVTALTAQTDLPKRDVEAVVQAFTDVITAVVSKGEPVAISGFAKFTKVERKARMGRNPATGEQIKIKASKKARITPLKGFKDAVLTPSQAPKLAKGVWPPAPAAAKPAAKKTTAKAAPARKTAAAAKKTTAKKATAGRAPAKTTARKTTTAKKATARGRR